MGRKVDLPNQRALVGAASLRDVERDSGKGLQFGQRMLERVIACFEDFEVLVLVMESEEDFPVEKGHRQFVQERLWID